VSWIHFSFGDFLYSFLSILFEAVPFVFLGSLLAGLMDAFLPSDAFRRFLPRNPVLAVLASGGLGVILPMCECGVIPVIRRMLLKGLPLSCGVTYLLAAPIVNPVVAFSTYAAFRGGNPGWIVSSRMLLGYGIAVLAGLIVSRFSTGALLTDGVQAELKRGGKAGRKYQALPAGAARGPGLDLEPGETTGFMPETQPDLTLWTRLVSAMRSGGNDFLDVGYYLVLGALITAWFNTSVNQQFVEGFASNHVVAVAAMMILALILSLCSTSDAFIAANFTAFPAAAKMAFMVFGPMVDIKLLLMYGTLFRRRFTLSLAFGLFVGAGLLCLAWGSLSK